MEAEKQYYLPTKEDMASMGWVKCDNSYSEVFGSLEVFSSIYRRAEWSPMFICVWPGMKTPEIAIRKYSVRSYDNLWNGKVCNIEELKALLRENDFPIL